MVVIAMISSSIGGYLPGVCALAGMACMADEVYFRDTAHGFIAWALASVLGAAVFASPATSLIGGTAAGVTQGAVTSAAQSSGPMDGYVDTMLRGDPGCAKRNANPADARGEVVRLFTRSFRNGGEFKAPDREYIVKVVAARTGLSQQTRKSGSMTSSRRSRPTSMPPAKPQPRWRSGSPLRCFSGRSAPALPRPKAVAFAMAPGKLVDKERQKHADLLWLLGIPIPLIILILLLR